MEDILIELAKWGAPSMFQFDDGRWRMRVNMRVNATGVLFEVVAVAETPTKAAQECLDRVNKVVQESSAKNALKKLT